MGVTFQNRWEENQKNLYSKEAEGKARGKNKNAFTRKRKMPVLSRLDYPLQRWNHWNL